MIINENNNNNVNNNSSNSRQLMSTSSNNFINLPEELVLSIFDYLTLNNMNSISLVNKDFRLLTQTVLKYRLEKNLPKDEVTRLFQLNIVHSEINWFCEPTTDSECRISNFDVRSISSYAQAKQLKQFLFNEGYIKTIKKIIYLEENLADFVVLIQEWTEECLSKRQFNVIQEALTLVKTADFSPLRTDYFLNLFETYRLQTDRMNSQINYLCSERIIGNIRIKTKKYFDNKIKSLSVENYEQQVGLMIRAIFLFKEDPNFRSDCLYHLNEKTLEITNNNNSIDLFSIYLVNICKFIHVLEQEDESCDFRLINSIKNIIVYWGLNWWSEGVMKSPHQRIDLIKRLILDFNPKDKDSILVKQIKKSLLNAFKVDMNIHIQNKIQKNENILDDLKIEKELESMFL